MTTPNDTTQIPYGYCHCGCGQKTNVPNFTNRSIGYIKDVPVKYVSGHHSRYSKDQQAMSFWNKVAITANDDLCWEWQGALGNNGYGNKMWNGQYRKAHQIAWMYPDYVIPDGMIICHSCDNRKCCNPKHLFLGTYQDNTDDMIAKGRQAIGDKVSNKGEKAGMHKLTNEQVIYIRERYAKGDISQKDLAKEMGMSKSMIGYIVNRNAWKHIP